MTLSSLAFWRKSGEAKAKVNGGGGAKQFLSKLSGAFMLPISVMSIAGLFLGVGAAIASHTTGSANTFGAFLQNLGDPVFGAMPVLFAAAIVVAFTDEAGIGVFATIIGMLIFAAIQSVFIDEVTDASKVHIGYKVLFGGGGRDAESLDHLVGSSLGIQSLNSSVFGGIVVGSVVAYLYNRFHTIQLPTMISFFGGKRFVSLVTIVAMIPVAFIFLLIWPYIGWVLAKFGWATGKVPYGFESFIFGFVERSLIPFGLHHVFYAPLWWTSAGGDALSQLTDWQVAHTLTGAAGDATTGLAKTMADNKSSWVGDSYTWIAASGLNYDTISWTDNNGGAAHSAKVFSFFADELEIKLGRYMQGKFPFMIFALPAAAAAMIFAAPKENRKLALGTIFPAALTSFVTGVTEPIEFTFLFLAPWLFWGFHAFMAAVSFLVMNVVGAHVGMTFSGGFLDLIIYGFVPFGKGTLAWVVIPIGLALAAIYFPVFFFCIKKFNLETPGRGSNTKLFTKADFKAKQSGARGSLLPQSAAIISAFGGWDNIASYKNCASRLRYDVKDASLVNESDLKAAGAIGVVPVGSNHFQVILGPKAEQINANIKSNIGTPLDNTDGVEIQATEISSNHAEVNVQSPTNGTIKSLESLNDGVFSEKLMGDGIVVASPSDATIATYYAPIAGELVTVFPTGHAYGIRSKEGVEVLIHIGLDTVNLEGQGFTPKVKQGEKVNVGDVLVDVDLTFVKSKAPSSDGIIIITSGHEISDLATGEVTKESKLFTTK